jgi:CubicO group peptidase (beta-lactamase class C family)
MSLTRAAAVLEAARAARAFAAVTAEVGGSAGPQWVHAAGRLTYAPDAPPVSSGTVFDLASLTKVLATATIALSLVHHRRLDLDLRVGEVIAEWTRVDRRVVTVRDLLEHASGLPGHRPYFRELSGRAAYQRAIAREPLEYEPRTRSLYSDLGFIILGFILEDVGGAPLDVQFDRWRSHAAVNDPLRFLPSTDWWPRIAATEQDGWRGRLLQGEVHDENAAALGGVAGHAGLFGSAAAVGDCARWWLRLLRGMADAATGIDAATAQIFARRTSVSGSSRALGWDTMLPSSSCGTRLSPAAIGHTGFTGTSLWIDPQLDLYAVLLTNRVHPTRDNDAIARVRREFHDAAVADCEPLRPSG